MVFIDINIIITLKYRFHRHNQQVFLSVIGNSKFQECVIFVYKLASVIKLFADINKSEAHDVPRKSL